MKPTSNGSINARRSRPAQERRSEPRFEATGAGVLIVLNSANDSERPAKVINVSRSGFQVELAAPIEAGASIELRLGKIKVFAEVVSCQPSGENRHRVSATTTRYIEPPKPPQAGK
jgi:hypothetical protein